MQLSTELLNHFVQMRNIGNRLSQCREINSRDDNIGSTKYTPTVRIMMNNRFTVSRQAHIKFDTPCAMYQAPVKTGEGVL